MRATRGTTRSARPALPSTPATPCLAGTILASQAALFVCLPFILSTCCVVFATCDVMRRASRFRSRSATRSTWSCSTPSTNWASSRTRSFCMRGPSAATPQLTPVCSTRISSTWCVKTRKLTELLVILLESRSVIYQGSMVVYVF